MPQSSVLPPAARRGIAHDPLLDMPLPQLLAEHDVELVDSSITDASFFGAVVERRDGHRVLAMPRGRSGFERDTVARLLLAEVFDWPRPALLPPLEVSRV